MSRREAEALAEAVRATSPRDVQVVPDEGFYVIEVHVERGEGQDTLILRDESDWGWLRDRIDRGA